MNKAKDFKWKYLYRGVDFAGDTLEFLLTVERDKKQTSTFLLNV